MNKNVFIIAGPSCSGKSYLASKLIERGDYREAISTTTRDIRVGEENGVHYHFVDREHFLEMNENNELVEHAEIRGNLYGVTRAEYENMFSSGKTPVIVCDPEGIVSNFNYCLEQGWRPVSIFIDVTLDRAIERFYDRYKVELAEGKNPSADDMAKNIMLAMLDETHWRRFTNYDMVIKKSDNEIEANGIVSKINHEKEIILNGGTSSFESSVIKVNGQKPDYPDSLRISVQDNVAQYLRGNTQVDSVLASKNIIELALKEIKADFVMGQQDAAVNAL